MRIQIIDNEPSSEAKQRSGRIEVDRNIITLRGPTTQALRRAMDVAGEYRATVEIRTADFTVIVTHRDREAGIADIPDHLLE